MTKDTFLEKLGSHIAALRKKAGMTQSELAFRCDKDRQNLNRLEKGRINPSVYYLLELSRELGVPLKNLVDFKQ